MTNLERRLCLAHAAWERWCMERALLEAELGCEMDDLGFSDDWGFQISPQTRVDKLLNATPSEILDRVRQHERQQQPSRQVQQQAVDLTRSILGRS